LFTRCKCRRNRSARPVAPTVASCKHTVRLVHMQRRDRTELSRRDVDGALGNITDVLMCTCIAFYWPGRAGIVGTTSLSSGVRIEQRICPVLCVIVPLTSGRASGHKKLAPQPKEQLADRDPYNVHPVNGRLRRSVLECASIT